MGHSRKGTLCLGCLEMFVTKFWFEFVIFFLVYDPEYNITDTNTWYAILRMLLLIASFLIRLPLYPHWITRHILDGQPIC